MGSQRNEKVQRDGFPVVVHGLFVTAGRIALIRRANTGFMDGYYVLPGGHQQHGEGITAALIRECREEVGAEPQDCRPLCVLPYRSGRHQGLNFLFEINTWLGEVIINEPELSDDLVWADPDALPEPHAQWIHDVMSLRRSGAWYREMEWD